MEADNNITTRGTADTNSCALTDWSVTLWRSLGRLPLTAESMLATDTALALSIVNALTRSLTSRLIHTARTVQTR